MFALDTVAHRQDGEGAAGQELLLRHAAMRALMARHQHDGDLVVGPGARADARILTHRSEATFGRSHQARLDTPAILEGEYRPMRIAVCLDDFGWRHQLDSGAGDQ